MYEFLEQFTAHELEKIERRDPLKRFSEKLMVTKTLEGRTATERHHIRAPLSVIDENDSRSFL